MSKSSVRVRLAGATDVGLVREHNEDSFLVVQLHSGETDLSKLRSYELDGAGTLLLVCDGMGGAAAGEVASAMAVQGMREALLREFGGHVAPVETKAKDPEVASAAPAPQAAPAEAPAEAPALQAPPVEAPAEAPAPQAPPVETPAEPPAPQTPPAETSPATPAPEAAPTQAPQAEAPAEPPAPQAPQAETSPEPSAPEAAATQAPPPEAPAQATEPAQVPTPSAEAAPPEAAPPEAAQVKAAPDEAAPNEAPAHPEPIKVEVAVEEPPAPQEADLPSVVSEDVEVYTLARRLREAVYAVNQEIFAAACADVAKAGMGTTLTGMLLQQTRVIVSQVGDSRAYLWRKNILTQITHDQSLVNQLLDTGQITPDQAKLFEHSNVILQALGVQEDVEVLVSTEVLRRGDRILLCSDGLVTVVSDEEIQEVMGLSESLEDTVKTLIDMARAAGGPDNITVIVAEVDGEGLLPPTHEDVVAYRPLMMDPPLPSQQQSDELGNTPYGNYPKRADQPPLSLSGVLSMAWVLGLLLAGLMVAYLLYPRKLPGYIPQRGAACYFVADRQGVEILVDGELRNHTMHPGTEVRMSPGAHQVRLRDRGHLGDPIYLRVAPGQRCAHRLYAPVVRDAAIQPSPSD